MLYLNELFIKIQCGMLLSDEKIHEIVSGLFTKALAGFEELRIEEPKTASQVEKHIVHFSKETLRELLRQNSTEFFTRLANLALEDEGIAIEPDSLQYQKLLRETLTEIINDIDVIQIDNQLMLDYRDKLVKLPPNRKTRTFLGSIDSNAVRNEIK